MGDHQLLSISEVGEATGLPSSTLRYYETAGLVKPQTRVGGRRHYEASVLRRLAVIALLQDAGFTIGEIAELFGRKGRRRSWRKLAETKLEELDHQLERVKSARELLLATLACECSGLESCELVTERQGRHRQAVQSIERRGLA